MAAGPSSKLKSSICCLILLAPLPCYSSFDTSAYSRLVILIPFTRLHISIHVWVYSSRWDGRVSNDPVLVHRLKFTLI